MEEPRMSNEEFLRQYFAGVEIPFEAWQIEVLDHYIATMPEEAE